MLLPWTCRIYAQFEAYAVPRADILDNVLSEADELCAHQQYVKERLMIRRQQSIAEGSANSQLYFSALYEFEAFFDQRNTVSSRYCDAAVDIARGEAKTYTGESECFFVGMLEVAKVPCSRDRLELLVPWIKEEVGLNKPTIALIFELLELEPPPRLPSVNNA